MADRIQIRRDTAANWASANPVLAVGEQGYETDTRKMKIGNGSSTWNTLSYFADTSSIDAATLDGLDSTDFATAAQGALADSAIQSADLATVATSGSYTDLSDQPSIPSITGLATETYVTTAVSNLVDTAPAALDTLNELAAALGDDADFAGTVTTSLAAKANSADLATVATSGSYNDLSDQPTVPAVLTDLSITDGTAGQVLSADGDGTYTFIDAASGGGGSFEAVASGSLSDGSTVVLNADGTVSVVAETEVPASNGAAVSIHSTAVVEKTIFDSNSNKVIILYRGASGYGTAIVGTVSGDSISFGTPVVFASVNTHSKKTDAVFDSISNKVVIVYRNPVGYALVGTVSGDSISFGSTIAYDSSSSSIRHTVAFDSNANKVVVFYGELSPSNIKAAVGTVSGTDISFGTAVNVGTGGFPFYPSALFYPSTNKVILSLANTEEANRGLIYVGTVSGDTISFGTAVSFEDDSVNSTSLLLDSNTNKVVLVWGYSGDINATVVTVSGDTVSLGSITTPVSGVPYSDLTAISNPFANKVIVSYERWQTDVVEVFEGTVSGDSISFGSPVVIATGAASADPSLVFDSNSNKVVISYWGGSGGFSTVYQSAYTARNLTAENYAGIADAAYADAATATIQTAGSVDDAQSGLTPGQAYYVQVNGTLATTPGTPSVFAGTAVSATSLLIGKEAPASTVAYADVTDTPTLATVATSGAYSDLTGTPTVPADVSDLTDTTSLLGGGGGSFEAVASGSLSDGSTVVLNADGTVSVVAEAVVPSSTSSLGTYTVSNAYNQIHSLAYDSINNLLLFATLDGSSIECTAGSIIDGVITFGSTSTISDWNGSAEGGLFVFFDSPSEKFVLIGRRTNSYPFKPNGVTITVDSATKSLTFGTNVELMSGSSNQLSIAQNPTTGDIVGFTQNSDNGSYGTAFLFSVVGGTLVKHEEVVPVSVNPGLSWINYDPILDKFVVSSGSLNNSYTRFVSVSDNSMTFSTPTVSNPMSNLTHLGSAYNPKNNNHVICYQNINNYGNYELYAVCATVTPSTLEYGTPFELEPNTVREANLSSTNVIYDPIGEKIVAFASDLTNTNAYRLDIDNAGTISSFNTFTFSGSDSIYYTRPVYDSTTQKIIVATSVSTTITLNSFTAGGNLVANLTEENYAGIADASYADAATATIQTAGSVDDAQSGLTPGQAYYVQRDGTLGLDPATPSVFAGTAVSATKLLIGKEGPAATVAYADVTDTPTLATVATSGSYNDLSDQPTVPADVSDLTDTTSLLGGGGGSFEAVASGSISDGAPAVLNADGTVAAVAQEVTTSLLYTLNNPNAYSTGAGDDFGTKVAISGNYAIVIASGEDDASGTNSGKAYIFNVTTGALLHTLNNPNPYGTSTNDSFGNSVAISGNYAIVGVRSEDEAGVTDSGKAYIYNVTTGALVHTLNDPNPYGTGTQDYFGNSVAISNTYAIVGAWYEDDAGGTEAGKAYIFDVTTGALVRTLDNPTAYSTSADDRFGNSVAISNTYAIVGAYNEDDVGGTGSGKAYIFDVTTGALVHTLDNPSAYGTSEGDWFGWQIATEGNYAIVSAYKEDDASGTESGKAYIFNVTTGALLHTLNNPNPYSTSASDNFGGSVAISGNYAMVGARDEDEGGTSSGKAYIFDVTTGALIHTYDNPNAYGTSEGDWFGQSMGISGNYAIVGAFGEEDASGTRSGKSYIYSVPTTTTNLTAENYAGIADAAYADAATATIQTAGSVDDAQSGLTPGQAYYVQADGTLGLAPGNPSVFAGTAVSATSLLIGKEAPAATVTLSDLSVTATAEELNTITTKLGTDSVIDGGTV